MYVGLNTFQKSKRKPKYTSLVLICLMSIELETECNSYVWVGACNLFSGF